MTVTRKDVINGKTYYSIEGRYGLNYGSAWRTIGQYTTDSLGYIMDIGGNPLFSNVNFTDTLLSRNFTNGLRESDYYLLTYKMEKGPESAIVPIGTFGNILNFKGTADFYNRPVNTDPTKDYNNPQYLNRYYAKGVGPILEIFTYISSGPYIENRLFKYKVNGQEYSLD